MKVMALTRPAPVTAHSQPLQQLEIPEPVPASKQVLLQVTACGVCHTELDEIEGRLPPLSLPRVLGHQVVGVVAAVGDGAIRHRIGDRVGVGWISGACGDCQYCLSDRENLCPAFCGTGYDIDGGYAERMVVGEDFAYPLPASLGDVQVAPMLCAGAIGYRSLRLAGLHDGEKLGLTGFGSSAHLVLPLARYLYPSSKIYVFGRDLQTCNFARQCGADWAGDTREMPPAPLDAIIDTTPAWLPVVEALEKLAPGGRLVINAIRKESADLDSLLSLDFARHLWREKQIVSVANVSRRDVREFLELAAHIGISPEVETFALADANRALIELKTQRVRGAKVLLVSSSL